MTPNYTNIYKVSQIFTELKNWDGVHYEATKMESHPSMQGYNFPHQKCIELEIDLSKESQNFHACLKVLTFYLKIGQDLPPWTLFSLVSCQREPWPTSDVLECNILAGYVVPPTK